MSIMRPRNSTQAFSFPSAQRPSSWRALIRTAGLVTSLACAAWSQADDRAVSLSRFNSPFDTGKLIYAYPAVTVESSVWSSSFASAPAPRSMPTAVSVQSSVWSSSFTPPPEPRSEAAVPPPELEVPAAKKAPRRPAPAADVEPEPRPTSRKKAPLSKRQTETAAVEPRKPQFRSKPALREKHAAPGSSAKELMEKEVMPPAMDTSLVHVSGTAGYYSRYMFRGLDVAYRTGIDQSNESAFFGASAAISIQNFALGFWYMNSLDSYVPGGAGFDRSFGDPNNQRDFRTPQRVRYQEYDLFANYTFRLAKDLSLTAGMNFYWFSDGRFWAQGANQVDNTMEAAASLNWTGIPYLNQTVNYFYDFDAFTGGFLEYKVSMRPLELYKNGDFAIGLSPNLGISYDFRYNGTNNGWNNFEPGIDVPIRITNGLSLNFGVRYAMDLGDSSQGAQGQPVDRTDDRLWFSATFQYTFPTAETAASEIGRSAYKDLALVLASSGDADSRRWRMSTGAGMRSMRSSFDVGRAKRYNIDSLFKRKTGGGFLGFATDTQSAVYLDGTVYSGNSSGYGDGTTDFTVRNAAQILDDGRHGDGGNNRQITYQSERFEYSTTNGGNGFTSDDGDEVVYPYLNLSYDVVSGERIGASIGVGYAFNHASMNSGARLAGLQTATENRSAQSFIYNVDELFSTNNAISPPLDARAVNNDPGNPNQYYLIYDAGLYDANYGTGAGNPDLSKLGPQRTATNTRQAVATVAAFRAATLDVDMHSISIPFDFTYKLSDRIRTRVSVGPTLNIFNEELTTDTYYQLLNPGAATTTTTGQRVVYKSPFDSSIIGGGVVNKPDGTTGTVSNAPTVSSTGSSSSAPSGSASGGKGSSDGRSRDLPGKKLARVTNHHSGQHFEAGVFGQVTVELDLDAAKRWFMEAYARYDYVPGFTISDGATSSEIEATSWGAGIGLGFRF